MVVPFADTVGWPDPGPPGRVPARCTDALHEVTGADTADTDANARTPDPGTPGRPHPDLGQRMRWTPARTPDGHPDTGRVSAWTRPSTWTGHLGTTALDRHPGPPRPPDCTGPPNRGLVDGACGARQRRGFGDGEVPAGARLPTALPGARSVAPSAKPRPGALLSSDDYGSRVRREAQGQVLWRVLEYAVVGARVRGGRCAAVRWSYTDACGVVELQDESAAVRGDTEVNGMGSSGGTSVARVGRRSVPAVRQEPRRLASVRPTAAGCGVGHRQPTPRSGRVALVGRAPWVGPWVGTGSPCLVR